MKKRIKLHRETLRNLDAGILIKVGGGVSGELPATQCILASCTYCNHTHCNTCIC